MKWIKTFEGLTNSEKLSLEIENEYKNNSDFIEEVLSGLSGSHLLRIYSFDVSVDWQEFNEELSKLLEQELKNN